MENLNKFKTWLGKMGAEVLPVTNEWELIRFRTVNGVSVIYANKQGARTYTGEALAAYDAYKAKRHWTAIDRKRQQLTEFKARLAARDGRGCFFCRVMLKLPELTVEHILSFKHGGTENINNLALACEDCNKALGTLPITKKILLWEKLRAETITRTD